MEEFLKRRLTQEPAISTAKAPWQREHSLDPLAFNSGSYLYVMDNGFEIEIKEDHLDIGRRVWDACIMMSKAVECGAIEIPSHSKILEIGSGTGLLGIVAKIVVPTIDITLTEIKRLIPHLQDKVEYFLPGAISVKELDWCSSQLENEFPVSPTDGYDIILACDITIDPRDIPHILRLLHHFVPLESRTEVYISCTIFREPHQEFMCKLSETFEIEVIEDEKLHPSFRSPTIVILRLRRKPVTDTKVQVP